MWMIVFLIFAILGSIMLYFTTRPLYIFGYLIAISLLTFTVIQIDKSIQTTDVEIWSGVVEEVSHKEAWDEWHPPETYEETEYYTDSSGERKSRTVKRTKPGYWEHHPAENHIKTSDDGWKSVSSYIDRDGNKTRFDDDYPRSTEELEKYYRIGMPTASTHMYENVVQVSSSLYKHKEINPKDYDLPEYPLTVTQFQITRLIGEFPNAYELDQLHQQWNSILNVDFKKQVNWILINLGPDATTDYGFALQEKWENGNKNDYITVMSLDENFQVNWVYSFTWSESEILNIKVQDYLLNVEKDIQWDERIDYLGDLIKEHFIRKEMADFKEYIVIEPSIGAIIILIILYIISIGISVALYFGKYNTPYRKRYRS